MGAVIVHSNSTIARHAALARANDPFRRYGPMDKHEVRLPDVTGQSLAERVQKTREMLRSMTAEQLLQVIEFHRDLNLFEALALAKRENKLIVPNYVHDRILTETKDVKLLQQLYKKGGWTGTLVIYEKPDTPFGEIVEYHGLVFQVPEQFRGKINCALAIEHPDFDILDLGNNRFEIKLIQGANIHLIENFPIQLAGWYKPHPETMIPQGDGVAQSKKARQLWRYDNAYVCLLRRVDYGFGYRKGIDLSCHRVLPFYRCEVAFVSLAQVSSSESSGSMPKAEGSMQGIL